MTSLFALRALLFAGELLAASLVIMALVWLMAAPRTASARHLAWAAAFGVLLALPAFALMMPATMQILLPAPYVPPPMPISHDLLVMMPVNPPAHGVSFDDIDTSDIVMALGVLWLLGVVLIGARLLVGAACLAILKYRSRPFALAPGDEPKVETRGRECELRLCDRDTGPITWGVFHPIVLLPKTALAWPRERLHAVLLHELAHIRRRDSLANALSHVACALYWPNPLVWIAAKKLRREAEIAADDAVINAGIKPSSYAGELLALAQEFRARQSAFAGMALFMAQPSSLEERVESVLANDKPRTGVTSMDVWKMAGLGLCAATAIALACPSLAQEKASGDSARIVTSDLPPPAAMPSSTPESAPPQATVPPPLTTAQPVHVARAEASDPDEHDSDAGAAPPPPPAPPAPPAPALPALPAPPPAPPAPPAPAMAATPDFSNGGTHVHIDGDHIWINGRSLDQLTPADRQRVREEIAKAREEAHAAMEKVAPEIEKAMAQMRASQDAVRAARPEIDRAMREVQHHQADIQRAEAELARHREEIARAELAVESARPQLEAASAEVEKHRAELDAAMAKIGPQIEAAMAKVHKEMEKQHIDADIQARVDEELHRAEVRIRLEEHRHMHDHDQINRVEERTDDSDSAR
ncbi:MAG TPA: M56 family metallopeptidase [Rhizomicrobium sp.]|nr:M56 family metallopeptidase [Rhizomicrobium sp.]